MALAAVRTVWQSSGASSWVSPAPDHRHSPAATLAVAVLLSIYAQCLDGQRDTYNARIQDLLDPEA